MKKLLFVIFIILLASPDMGISATETEKLKYVAQKYYWGKGVEKDYAKALDLYLQAAQLGDTEAKYIAGGMYYKGIGTRIDKKKAFDLLYGAALQGNSTPQSQKILGQLFLTGSTTPRNYTEARKWYKLSAENGDRESQSELAFLYFTGKGGSRDLEQAFYWYERAANQGLAVAQYSLGIMYYSGSGTEQPDLIKSYGWLSLAASQKHVDAQISRDYLETVLSSDELEKAQNYSVQLFQQMDQ